MKTTSPRTRQKGMSLLESLIAILIFSVGILALVALQATSVRATTDAKLRADASFMESQLVAGMWTDFSNIAGYAYNAAGANCAFTGGAGNAAVNAWATNVQAALPGASAQVVFGVNNLVTISICWPSGDPADPWRRYQTVTQINL